MSELAWIAGIAVVAAALLVELRFFAHGRAPSPRESVYWSLGWIALAIAAAVVIHLMAGADPARDFITVYVIERSLSLDNLFLFLLILGYFQVPDAAREKVIVLGIAGALLLRAAAIVAGVALVERLEPVVYVLGAALVYLAYRVLRGFREEFDPLQTPFVRAVRRFVPLTGFHGERVFVREDGRLRATPLLLALSAIVFADIAFAIDSVPAALAITREPLVIWLANGFALVGLLALLTLLDDLLRRFRYLDETIGLILAFVGVKLLLDDVVPIGDLVTLAVIVGALVLGVVASSVADRLAPEPEHVVTARTPPRCPPALTATGSRSGGGSSLDHERPPDA
jgi:tellurite resistance protein TerC